MLRLQNRSGRWRGVVCLVALSAAFVALSFSLTAAGHAKVDVLHIGTSGNLTAQKQASGEKGALESLQSFIKEETGFENDITRQKDWQELTDKMTKGQCQVGVFQGYEFAWASKDHPDLKPLALAINLYRYPVVYVVTNKTNAATDFAGLKGQSLGLPDTGQPYLRLFVERECKAQGKDVKEFFSKLSTDQGVEDCLDDAVDGTLQVAVVDRAALEAFKQRKPGRFSKLKVVAKSPPLPPVVIAYAEKSLDEANLKRFRDGLFGAGKTEKGKTLLTLFHITGFDPVPDDFDKVLADTRKEFPPPAASGK
jgi:ABC-type phosphate/phosphonate transport system substrate-binding protein